VYRAEDVADEAKAKELLQHGAEELDVGSLARSLNDNPLLPIQNK